MYLGTSNTTTYSGERVLTCPMCRCEMVQSMEYLPGRPSYALYQGECGHVWGERTYFYKGQTLTEIKSISEILGL